MNKSQKIYFDSNEIGNSQYIKVRLEQDVDTFEFMSMQLSTKDVYQDFNSDYGVLVGKVTANGGVGIPNAKISIFIPLSDEDASMGQITSIYPYKTPRDKNKEGKRYNLLPRVSKIDPKTNQLTPKQPFGSFPIKEEIVTNTLLMDVYKKYYKYTALTNNAGDYMIFGVPTGTQTVHMSVDITDIGEFSMNPASMVTNLGYSPNLFTDGNSKVKPSSDLGDLPNIETQEITVDVIPFWGDTTNFDIGITRQDFRIRATLVNTFTIFGSVFTDSENTLWGDDSDSGAKIKELYRAKSPSEETFGMSLKRTAKVTEKIYYYPPTITDEMIDNNETNPDGNDMLILDPSEYSSYKRDGDFVFVISANRNKILTDELGNVTHISNDSPDGVYTQFRGFVIFEITENDARIKATGNIGGTPDVTLGGYRYRLKFPQYADSGKGLSFPGANSADTFNKKWRKQNYIFNSGKFYSVSRFHGLTYNNENDDEKQTNSFGFLEPNSINNATEDPNRNVGIIETSDNGNYLNSLQQFPHNGVRGGSNYFGGNWINFSIYLQQSGYVNHNWDKIKYIRTADHFQQQYPNIASTTASDYFLRDNPTPLMPVAAYDYNVKWLARSDLHWTDFVEVEIKDLVFLAQQGKGYTYNPDSIPSNELPITGKYRSGRLDSIPTTGGWTAPCPITNGEPLSAGGIDGGNPANITPDPNIYFYKGVGEADCIKFLIDLGLIN